MKVHELVGMVDSLQCLVEAENKEPPTGDAASGSKDLKSI
jgi:hypothetical protein